MTVKDRFLACLSRAEDDISAEEAIHRLVLLTTLDRATSDSDEMDHEESVRELEEGGAKSERMTGMSD